MTQWVIFRSGPPVEADFSNTKGQGSPLVIDLATNKFYHSVGGLPTEIPVSGGSGSVAWADITGKPSTFPPEAHTHAITDVTGLQTALDGKQAIGSYAAAVHTHLSTDITDFLEASQDVTGAMVAAAGGSYNDAAGTITFPSSSGTSGPYAAMMLTSNYTLTSTTSQQKLFNLGTSSGGAVLLEAGIYKTRIQLYITSMSTTAGNGTFSILGAGTATLGKSMQHSVGIDSATPTNTSTQTGAWSINTVTNNMATNATGPAMAVTIEGILHVTVAGTVIPSIALTTAAAAVVNAPSYVVFDKLADLGTTTIGTVT